MSNQEILEKAIQKAVAGGWKPLPSSIPIAIDQWRGQSMVKVTVLFGSRNETAWVRELEGIIFNHDFAKALWGDEEGDYIAPVYVKRQEDFEHDHTDSYHGPAWKHHLMQMVIADDPIKYLGENI